MKKLYYLIILFLPLFLSSCIDSLFQDPIFQGKKYLAQVNLAQSIGPDKEFIGVSDNGLAQAKINAETDCLKYKLDLPISHFSKNKSCVTMNYKHNLNHPEERKKVEEIKLKRQQEESLLIEKRRLETEYERLITQCEFIGFKRNTDKMGDCVLKLYGTEIQIANLNAQERSASSSDVLNRMLILNESLKLLRPPQYQSNNPVSCQARPFGRFLNIYCN
jgi:hypothetical protein